MHVQHPRLRSFCQTTAVSDNEIIICIYKMTRYRWYHAEQKLILYHACRSYVAPTDRPAIAGLCGGGAGYRPRVHYDYSDQRLSP